MIETDREVCMTPSEADRLLSWPLDVLTPYIARGLVFHHGRKVRVIDRFGNDSASAVTVPTALKRRDVGAVSGAAGVLSHRVPQAGETSPAAPLAARSIP